jgi:hypothetical protein
MIILPEAYKVFRADLGNIGIGVPSRVASGLCSLVLNIVKMGTQSISYDPGQGYGSD